MRIAIIGDIHGNLEALQAVAADIDARGVDRVYSLGDNVGYGPDPQAVVDLLRERAWPSVLGNHEFALGDLRGRRWLNFQAAENNATTASMLDEEARTYCCGLPLALDDGDCSFVHGFPPRSPFKYLNRQSEAKIAALFTDHSAGKQSRKNEHCYFVGHTHRLQLFCCETGRVRGVPFSCKSPPVVVPPGSGCICSCGAVGQPRGRDRRASYVLWDQGARTLTPLAVPYDFRLTQEKIRALGFPEIYAQRLGDSDAVG